MNFRLLSIQIADGNYQMAHTTTQNIVKVYSFTASIFFLKGGRKKTTIGPIGSKNTTTHEPMKTRFEN